MYASELHAGRRDVGRRWKNAGIGVWALALFATTIAEAASPIISNFSPQSGPVGTTVTITGKNFSATRTSNTVKFNGTTATVSSSTTTQIITAVPSGATTGKITVKVGSSTATSSSSFTVVAPPTIASFSPGSGPLGTSVTIIGANFSPTKANNTVKFNGVAATVASATSTQLVASVPSGAASGPISVTVSGFTATSSSGFVVTTTPIVSAFNPTSGVYGTQVTIAGANFDPSPSNDSVAFNGVAANVVSATSAQLIAVVPASATSGKISVTINGQTGASSTSFAVPSPTLASFSPNSGGVGTPVTITGTNFSTVPADNVVAFHGTAATVTAATGTQITAVVPVGATSGTIKVTVGSHSATSSSNFTVRPAPTITGMQPAFGPPGTTIEIDGTNFSATQSNNTVIFGGATATTFSSVSATQLFVNVPLGAGSGPVTVISNGISTTSPMTFTVLPGSSATDVTIDQFAPSSGSTGTLVTLLGNHLGSVPAISFNGVDASIAGSTSNGLVVLVPQGAVTGPITATDIYGNSVSSISSFTVAAGVPSISRFSPSHGPAGSSLVIQGANFSATPSENTVTVNGAPLTVTEARSDQLLVTLPTDVSSGPIQIATQAGQVTSQQDFIVVTPNSNALTIDGPSAYQSGATVGQNLNFTFAGQAGRNIGLAISSVTSASANSFTAASVTSPTGSVIANADCARGCTFDLANLPQTGTYTVTLNPNTNIQISALATLSSDITGSLDVSSPYTVATMRLGQVARIGFDAKAGDSYGLDFSQISITPGMSVSFSVVRPDGIPIGVPTHTGGAKSVIPLVDLPIDGRYSVVVVPQGAPSRFSVRTALVAPTQIAVDGASVVQDTSVPGQMGLFSFTGASGQAVGLHLDFNTAYGTPTVVLYAQGGSIVPVQFDPLNAMSFDQPTKCGTYFRGTCLFSYVLPADGVYLMWIGGGGGALDYGGLSSAFSAELKASDAFSLTADGASHNINVAPNRPARLVFPGNAGQSLQLQWGAPISVAGYFPNMRISVYSPDGSPLTWTQGPRQGLAASALNFPVLPSTGIYTIQIDFDPDSFGTLPIVLTTANSGQCANSNNILYAGVTITGVMPSPVLPGQGYTVSAAEYDCNQSGGTIRIGDDSGNSCTFTAPGSTSCTLPPTIPGKHVVTALVQSNMSNVAVSTIEVPTGNSMASANLSISPDPTSGNQQALANVAVQPISPATALPTGWVDVDDQFGNLLCRIALPKTWCQLSGRMTAILTARYLGDSNYAPITSAPVALTSVGQIGTKTTILDMWPDPSSWIKPFTTRVSVDPLLAGEVIPTGSITVAGGGYGDYCTISIPGDDSCDLSLYMPSFYPSISVKATYQGDAVFSGSTASAVHHLSDGSTASVAITAVAAEPSAVGQAYEVDASVTVPPPIAAAPTGNVTITDGTSSCTFALPASGCQIADASPGMVSLVAQYGGDANYAGAVSNPISHSVSSPGGPASVPPGYEICGFDPNSTYPISSSFTPVSQLGGAVFSLGLDASILGQPKIQITFPPQGANVYGRSSIYVVGTVSGPLNTGVTVNGVPVPVVDGRFALENVPLTNGNNGFSAIATTMTGLTATSTVGVYANTTGAQPLPSITVTSPTTTGFAPLTMRFAYSAGALQNNATVKSITIDLDGDGSPEFDGTSFETAPTSFTYTAPGFYTPTLTIVDSNNLDYTVTTTVAVQDVVRKRAMLCDVYGYLKDRLNQADAAGAALAFQPEVRDQYQSFFATAGSNMPSIVPMLGVIANGLIDVRYAQLIVVRDEANLTHKGFPLKMTQDAYGVWRIGAM